MTPTIDITKARADWDAIRGIAPDYVYIYWAKTFAEPLLTALEARSEAADELAGRAERIAALEEALRQSLEANSWHKMHEIARTALGETDDG